jgi:hypothetical protein
MHPRHEDGAPHRRPAHSLTSEVTTDGAPCPARDHIGVAGLYARVRGLCPEAGVALPTGADVHALHTPERR